MEGGKLTLRIEYTDRWARVSVGDDGSSRLPCWCRARRAATNGRGTELLDSLATRWGVLREGVGSTVWFELGGGTPCDQSADPRQESPS